MLNWLRSNWFLLTAASVAALYQLLRFSLALSACSDASVYPGGRSLGEYAAQNGPNYTAIEADAAVLAAIAGVLLVAVTLGLWRATNSLATSTEDLAKGAASQTAAMEKATDLAVEQHGLAEKQFALAADQHGLAQRSHGLQRLEFFTKYKPKLEIRFVQLVRSNPSIPERRKYVEFSVINIGETAATITGSNVRLDWFYLDDVPNPDAVGGVDLIFHERLAIGGRQRRDINVTSENSFSEGFSEVPDSRLSQAQLILLGWIVYYDDRGPDLGDPRTTYFCRAYDPGTDRFAPIPELADWEFTH
jgi:hypothetical protein